MKLAITANGNDLNAYVERRFTKAPFFIVVDTETMKYKSIPIKTDKDKENMEVKIAKEISCENVDTVLTGFCSDSAFHVFRKSNIMVYETAQGNVNEQVKSFIQNWLNPLQNLNNSENVPFWAINKTNGKCC